MKTYYLEVVTPDVEGLCAQYTATHGLSFSDPAESLGDARTARSRTANCWASVLRCAKRRHPSCAPTRWWKTSSKH